MPFQLYKRGLESQKVSMSGSIHVVWPILNAHLLTATRLKLNVHKETSANSSDLPQRLTVIQIFSNIKSETALLRDVTLSAAPP